MKSIASQFYAGQFSAIVSQYVDGSTIFDLKPSNAVFVVGSLSFLSRSVEAETILLQHRPMMSDRERFEASYYLATALRRERTRTSSAKARVLLVDMIRDIRRLGCNDDYMQFFLCCGIAFYRYVDGRFPLALNWAQKAYDHAFRANFPFGRLVAYDMIGHSQLIVGQIRAGLKNLNSSAMIAESIGQGAIRQAVDVASRLYKSTYGLGVARDLMADLSGAIKACAFENSYTLASLYIELSRLQILAGDGHRAEDTLRDASEWVYRLDIPFLDAHLSFRYAHLACLQGDLKKALELVRSAKNRAIDAQSASIMVGILGLEYRILNLIGEVNESEKLRTIVRDLGEKSGQVISQRINVRNGLSASKFAKRGEDLLGDLLDDINSNVSDVRSRIINSGFLGLIPKTLGVKQFGDAIIFGFEADSVTVISKGQIRHDRDGWPDLVRKLFLAFAESKRLTKEEMTEKVWRQNYSPLRHDPLIYALIARTRKTLENFEDWLTVQEGAYSLRDSVLIRDVTLASPQSVVTDVQAQSFEAAVIPSDVSYRQAKILEFCSNKGAISNKDVCEKFNVSEVTAGRDLADLATKGHLKRVGKGRATVYTKP